MAIAELSLRPVRVSFARPVVADLEGEVVRQLTAIRAQFPPKGSVAIAVGSRGVANIARIVRQAVSTLRGWGLHVFVVPAMGSHGGATGEGQTALLAGYGVTPAGVGCAVESSMEVVTLEAGDLPHGLFMDRRAFESDGVLLVNRIKPHTDFHGAYESGLAKMAVIGLGKERQAIEMHRFGVPGLRDGIPRAARHLLATGRIVGGLAVVENAYDETMAVEGVAAGDIMAREPDLLELARRNMPALPVDVLDVLIVDRIGKDVSGTGMDTNVIGRMRIAGEAEPDRPRVRTIVACDLTDVSHGNATGVGLADVVTRRLFDKIDVGVTYTNVFTSGFPERGKIPIVAPTAADAYLCARRACGPIAAGTERVARIRDTLHLGEILVSEAVAALLSARADVTIEGRPRAMFTEAGDLTAEFDRRMDP